MLCFCYFLQLVRAGVRLPRELRPFRLVTRIPAANFIENKSNPCVDLHYDAEIDALFVTDAKNQTVNVLCPAATASPPRPVYTAKAPAQPSGVCLVRPTGTLLVANFADQNRDKRMLFSLVSLSRDAQQWRQQSELPMSVEMQPGISCTGLTICKLANSTVVMGALWSRQLFVVSLTPTHRLTLLRELQIPEQYLSVSSAVQIERTLIALMFYPGAISINRLVEDRLEQLSQLELGGASWQSLVLWSGEHLLLGEQTGEGLAIVKLDTSRTPLARATELLPREADLRIRRWCADGERVCVWDGGTGDILVYSVC